MILKKQYNLLKVCYLFIATAFTLHSQTGTVTIDQDERITQLLTLKKSLKKENKLTDGFTIQLYYGNLNTANGILNNYKNKYTQWPAAIEYETPNYKVWVGNFSNRLEADRALLEIKETFDSAFILKPGRNKKED